MKDDKPSCSCSKTNFRTPHWEPSTSTCCCRSWLLSPAMFTPFPFFCRGTRRKFTTICSNSQNRTEQVIYAFPKGRCVFTDAAGESENEGADYSGSLSQCSFHGIGLAVESFRSVFGSSAAAPLCSILTQWAECEAKKCAEAVQNNALSAFAGLSSVVSSVAMSLVYAHALKNTHSIDLVTVLHKVFWPTIEGRGPLDVANAGSDFCMTDRLRCEVF